MPKNINIQIFITLILLIATITFFQWSRADIALQDFFYDFATQSWLIDKQEPIMRFFLYRGLKIVLVLFAVSILFSLWFFRKKRFIKEYRKGLIVVLLSMMLVPATVGTLKTTTKVPCPHDIVHYGGSYPDVKVLDAYPKDFLHKSNVRCWPAGHASGGFALMSLYFLFKTPKNKKRALIVAIVIGWIMGLYKMLLGDHYLSHTIVTMLLSWLLILIVVKIVYRKDKLLEKVA